MTAPEMKPCPFCGETDTVILNGPVEDDWCAVVCNKCSARGPINYTDHHAITAWNRRADFAAVQPAQVRVKPLVWKGDSIRVTANGMGKYYSCMRMFHGQKGSGWECDEGDWHPTIEAAKAAAQADYEARILAALEPQPISKSADLHDPRDEVIKGLVEALRLVGSNYLLPPQFQVPIDAALSAAKAVQQ